MKGALDRFAALVALILLWPLMAVVAILVRIKLGSPVLFKQVRPGRDGKLFTLIKFRTMRNAVDASGRVLPDDQRLPKFGKMLRSTSLDELPEIFNILKGEMSWVGPRPLLVQYLDRYTPEQARRHEVLPGLTGWAQVNGRNALGWEEKFALDVWYVDHRNLALDVKIAFMTVAAIFNRKGITMEGSATAEEFQGSGNVKEQIYIIGAGGHAKVVLSTLRAAGLQAAGFLEESAARKGESIMDCKILGQVKTFSGKGLKAVIAIGDNAARERIAKNYEFDWISVVHPSVVVDPTAQIGPGSVVFAGVVVQPLAKVGAHTILNTSCSVDHDGVIGDYCHIAPGARLAGTVTVEEGAFVGIAAAVIQGMRVGAWSIVGAGAVVIDEVAPHTTVVGCPARALSTAVRRFGS